MVNSERRGALVTGAAGAIGGAVARRLTARGLIVVCHDRVTAPDTYGDHWLRGDISGDGARSAIREAEAALSTLDVVAHCAGGADPTPFLEIEDAEWDAVLELNGSATFRLVQEAARVMAPRARGRVVVVSSLCAQLAWSGFGHYCAAKAATDMVIKAAAAELGPLGLQINAVLPGTIRTPLTDRVGMDTDAEARLRRRTPLGRLGEAEEIAETVSWLACDAPDFLTGAQIVVDGGYGIDATP
jgi:3-oxoacyl-[acyl-carrier protein] reductase